MNDKFNSEVAQKIQHYVYRLIDPRNGETFYVGRGQNNRVFDHARGELTDESGSQKMSRIREIKLSGLKVSHVIHRHGMDKPTAKDVEAALIEAYPGLTNIMGGDGNNDFGVMHSSEIIKKYSEYMRKYQNATLRIEGHADERGSRAYNLALGEKRAETIKEIMLINGVSKNSIEVVSYGEENPAVLGTNEDTHSLNRRVEIIFSNTGK